MTNLEHFADTKQIAAQGTALKLFWNWLKKKKEWGWNWWKTKNKFRISCGWKLIKCTNNDAETHKTIRTNLGWNWWNYAETGEKIRTNLEYFAAEN